MDANANNQNIGCAQVADALSAHFDGVADETARHLATSHLQSCPACARMWAQWQELKALEQMALQPVSDKLHGTVPLAPVVPPRHLASSILNRTSRATSPLQRIFGAHLWPRLALGAGLPAVAAACWALWALALAPNSLSTSPTPPTIAAAPPLIDNTANQPSAAPVKVDEVDVSVPSKNEDAIDSDNDDANNKAASSASARLIATSTNSTNATRRKSTFTRSAKRPSSKRKQRNTHSLAASPQPHVSVALAKQPQSRATRSTRTTPKPATRIASSPPRVTTPVPISAPEPADTLPVTSPHDGEISDPMVEYIEAHDVRPEEIRQAVEGYRAALFMARLDDSER